MRTRAQPYPATFQVDEGERIVEGRTVIFHDRRGGQRRAHPGGRAKKHALHVLIVESKSGVTRHAHIEVPSGVPIPGKGESGYDCGEDAVYGLTCRARTVKEAVERFVDDIRETRKKRGG